MRHYVRASELKAAGLDWVKTILSDEIPEGSRRQCEPGHLFRTALRKFQSPSLRTRSHLALVSEMRPSRCSDDSM